MTYCVIMPTEFGFNACGVDVYKSGRYIVSGYSRSAECNPENGASMMTFTLYELKPGADQSYVLCGGCAEGDSILGYGAGYCNPSDPSVLIPNARTLCRKLVKKPASVCGFSCPAGFSASQPTYNRGCDLSPDDANTSANSVYCTPAT